MAQEYEKISKVEEVTSKTEKAEKVDILDRTSVQEGKFDEFLHKQDQSKVVLPVETQAKNRQSLMDEVRDLHTKVEQAGKASAESLAGHARDLIAQIEEVKNKLATSNVEIKGSVQTLLKNKLSHIDENLKIALDKAGVEYANAPVAASQNLTNPIDRFLGFLTNGQYQLQHLSAQLEHMSTSGEQLSPARMLAVQIKVGYITQELELFYNLLNKALESTKTIMNVQV